MAPRRKIKPKPPPSVAESGQSVGKDGSERDGESDAQSEEGKDYQCTLCDSTFESRSGLHYHMNIHKKKFACQYCGKCCSCPANVQRHEKTHSDERPFSCPNCDHSLKTRDKLTIHYKSCIKKKPTTDINCPFQCNTCSKRFKTDKRLRGHQYYHSDKYKCDECGRRCSSLKSLGIHQQIHSGEKPFRCKKCNYRATRKTTLVRHGEICKLKERKSRFIVTLDQPVNKQENAAPLQNPLTVQLPNRNVTEEECMGDYRPSERINLKKESGDFRLGGLRKKTERKRLDEDSDDSETLESSLPNSLFPKPKSGRKYVEKSIEIEQRIKGNGLDERNEAEEGLEFPNYQDEVDAFEPLRDLSPFEETAPVQYISPRDYSEQMLAAEGQNQQVQKLPTEMEELKKQNQEQAPPLHKTTCKRKRKRRLHVAEEHPIDTEENADPAYGEESHPVQSPRQNVEEDEDFINDYRSSDCEKSDPRSGVIEPRGRGTDEDFEITKTEEYHNQPAVPEEESCSGPHSGPRESCLSFSDFDVSPENHGAEEDSNTDMGQLIKSLLIEIQDLKEEFDMLKRQHEWDSTDIESSRKLHNKSRQQARKARRLKKRSEKKKAEKRQKVVKEVEDLLCITQEDFGLKARCAWCWCTDHFSDHCSNFLSFDERLECKKRRFLCDLCLVFHPGRICFVSPPCPHCPEKGHHPAICTSEAHQLFLERLS